MLLKLLSRRPQFRTRPVAVGVCLLLIAPHSAAAQHTATQAEKSIRARTITTPPRLDGVLDDAVWEQAQVISDFVQQEPRVGDPVTERTEVRIVITDEAIYFGISCFDAEPSRIIARELRRDDPLSGDDRFEIVLDTFHDHRNAFHFAINPLGTQYDALITDEGQDVNVEWDERWWAETTISPDGWFAEVRIPFTTLRSRHGTGTFGVNFKRFIRRKTEVAQWTGWDRDFSFLQVSQAGHLEGVEGIRTGLKLRLKPYVLGGFDEVQLAAVREGRALREIGIETLKVSLTPALTAELTFNTDFAQAEVDQAVVNLTRFPVFFPERREFFLERAGIFEFGLGGRRGGAVERNLQMFFSRRIGLTEDRRPAPILGGAKVTGRAAGLDLGLLNVQTERFEGQPGSNYTVLRAKRNVLSRSNVGAFVSNRESSGSDYHNRVIGADANFTLFKNTDIQGFVGRSMTTGRDGNDMVGRAKYNWMTDLYEVFIEHLYIGPEFQHDAGFIRRSGIQRTDTTFVWEPRPGRFNIRNFVFRGQVVYTTDIHRSLLSREQIFATTARFQNDEVGRFSATETFDRLHQPFQIADGVVIPAGDYNFRETWAEYESSGKRPLVGKLRYGRGQFYSGHRQYLQFTPIWRPSPLLSFESGYEWNDVELHGGQFTTHLVNARMNLNLSNRWLTTTLAQYDSASRRNLVYWRLNYIYRPGDDLFIVYSQSDQAGLGFDRPPDRRLMVKLTYSVDF